MRKYIFVLAMLFVFTTAVSVSAFTGKGCGGECRDCHTLTKKEAEKLLKVKKYNAKILKIEQSPVKGLWAIELSENEKPIKLYIDYGKKHLIGNITKLADLGKPPKQPELRKIDLKKIPLEDALIMGNPDAKYKVIVFDDPDCPYCAKLHVEIKKILKKRKDIAFYIKLFPLPMHPEAYEKSKAILCGKSKAVSLLDDVFAGKDIGKPKCKTGRTIDDNIKLAAELGITGTPSLILPGGYVYPGYAEADVLIGIIEKAGKK
ncbi:Thiol:disulfide interchange protein DsbC [hydrothermal vent metagenome]|uniref:Thiol:disulfide interchange protein DsbC n=1 Tax=hydrothermal vent metagenome TaxID=652676 RepID=A0A3B0QQQ4_9ZZZZ